MKKIGLFICVIIWLGTSNLFAQVVRICDDDDEWPPYAYHPRIDGKPDTSQLTGFTTDLFKDIFKIMEMDYEYELIPWVRCLKEVEQFGKRQQYEVFANGSMTNERHETYWATTPIYYNNQVVFYRKEKYPDGPELNSLDDLKKYKVCGVLGWGFSYYELEDEQIDKESNTLNGAMYKLKTDRCDIIPNPYEAIHGYETVGKIDLTGIESKPIPGFAKSSFHIYISKSSPRAFELLTKMNQAILILQFNGVAERLMEKYLPSKK